MLFGSARAVSPHPYNLYPKPSSLSPSSETPNPKPGRGNCGHGGGHGGRHGGYLDTLNLSVHPTSCTLSPELPTTNFTPSTLNPEHQRHTPNPSSSDCKPKALNPQREHVSSALHFKPPHPQPNTSNPHPFPSRRLHNCLGRLEPGYTLNPYPKRENERESLLNL